MPLPWGAIIGAGASIIGSLFGSKKEKPQVTSSHVDYKRLVRDAEAAGFNPLTALRAGGGAGYTVTSHPALSSSNPIGEVLGQVGNALMSYDPQAEKRARLEYDLVQAQLENIQADTLMRRRSFDVPVRTGARVVGASGRPLGNDGNRTMTAGNAVTLAVNPANTPASDWSEQYGEPGDWIGGFLNLGDDAMRTLTGTSGPVEAGGKLKDWAIEQWQAAQPAPGPALPMGYDPRQIFASPW